MIDIAANSDILKKRVQRIFDSPRFVEVSDLVEKLSSLGEVLVFGGLLRDIAMYGVREFYSDVDLVVDCQQNKLDEFFQLLPNARRNKFGGYRFQAGSWDVDVWPVCETWAFRKGLVNFRDKKSLLLTTISNWDAILYSFEDKKIIFKDGYFDDLTKGRLELILSENPNELGVLMRMLRSIHDGKAGCIMPKALMFLQNQLEKRSRDEVYDAQFEILGRIYFSKLEIDAFREELKFLQPDFFGSEVFLKGRNYGLDLDD
jgi:predicted nucleotidyltransferase